MFHVWSADGNPDAEDVFDDEDLMAPLSPTGKQKRKKILKQKL